MTTVKLPRVAVSRELATSLVADVHVGSGDDVEINGRGLVVNNESFAYQLATDLAAAKPARVRIVGGSAKWHKDFTKAAIAAKLDSLLSPRVVA